MIHHSSKLVACAMVMAALAEIELLQPRTQARSAEPRVALLNSVPEAPQVRPLDAWAKTADTRPLFASNRRPAAPAAEPTPDLPRLTGTIGIGGVYCAILQPPTGRSVTVALGASVLDWKIQDIGNSTVTLIRGDHLINLSLRAAETPDAEAAALAGPAHTGVTGLPWPGQWVRAQDDARHDL